LRRSKGGLFKEPAWKLCMTYVLLGIGAVIMLFPLLWAVSTSLKSYSELIMYPFSFLPRTPLWSTYLEVFKAIPLLRYAWNTIKVSFLCTFGVLGVSSLAAYAFAKLEFPGRNFLFTLYLATMIVPRQVVLVPVFILMRDLGLVDTHASLVLSNIGLMIAFGTFLLRQFFLTIPKELEEAATIDGCGYFGRFMRIVLPLSRPGLATLGIFTLLNVWNDYLYPLVFINSPDKRTLTLGLAIFRGDVDVQWNLLMAAVLLSILPMLLAFLFAQKYFVEGIALTGLKS